MPPAVVRFHPAAAQEAESAYDWYAVRSPTAAQAFRAELAHAVVVVGNNPFTWPRYGRRARRYVLPRFPFNIVYRIRGDEVEIRGRRSAPPLIRRVRADLPGEPD